MAHINWVIKTEKFTSFNTFRVANFKLLWTDNGVMERSLQQFC